MRYKLKETRLKNDLTQAQLAKKINIARATYTNIELGYKNPSLKVAMRIKDVLGYKEDDLFLNAECRNDTEYSTEIA